VNLERLTPIAPDLFSAIKAQEFTELIPLGMVIYSFAIPGVDIDIAFALEQHFLKLYHFTQSTTEELSKLKGINNSISEAIIQFIGKEAAMLKRLNTLNIVSFESKTVENMIKGIEASKKVPFEKVLFAIGIRNIGEVAAKKIAKAFHDIETIMSLSAEQLTEVHEVGEVMANSIIQYFADLDNRQIVQRLKDKGLQMAVNTDESKVTTGPLNGLSVIASGTFSSFSRDGIIEAIENNGGRYVSSISSKTDLVVAGEKMGPNKLQKAQELGIKIINEQEFLRMIGRG
jgi:DNA ligase (NAD+)